MFSYRVYGLTVASEVELPELPESSHYVPVDLLIRLGDVPKGLDDVQHQSSWFEANARACLFTFPEVCRLLVRDGREITIDRQMQRDGRPSSAADVRLYLLGSAMGAALHQRGLLPLHVSAVRAPNGVWAFTGPSGAGKSTLSATLSLRYGMPLVSDDVSALRLAPPQPMVFPGPRKLKLWQDAAEHLRCDPDSLVQDLSGTAKYQLYLDDDDGSGAPEPLQALVLLEPGSEPIQPQLEKLSGGLAFDVCLTAVYRPYMADWYRPRQAMMADLLRLCSRIEVYRFRRHWSLEAMDEQLTPLMDAMCMSNAPNDRVACK